MNSHLRVLLVEDNPGDADLVQEYLSQAQQALFKVECVPRLALAISLLEREQFDLILLDLGLPDSTGLETLKHVLQTEHLTPIVVLTGLHDEQTGLEAARLGAQDYILKGHIARNLLIRTILFSVERSRTRAELQRNDAMLRASEEHLRRLFEQSPLGIAILDLDYRWVQVNPRLCEMIGYSQDELVQLTFADITHPDDIEDDLQQTKKMVSGAIPVVRMEKRYIRKNGEVLWADLTVALIRDPDGNPLHFLATIEDISERKRSEEVLRESEERYRLLFENMLEGFTYCRMIFEHGTSHDIIYLSVNEAFGRLTGLKNVVGRKVSEVIPGIRESNPELFEIYGRVCLTGIPEQFETYLDTLSRWFSISAYSTEEDHFIAVFDNITERKLAEKDLQTSYRLLQITLQSDDIPSLLNGFLRQIKKHTGHAAVGSRLLDEQSNIP